jgi:hypothetical protein
VRRPGVELLRANVAILIARAEDDPDLPQAANSAFIHQHARWARFADGADEVHQMRIAQRTIAAYKDEGSTRSATGDLPL